MLSTHLLDELRPELDASAFGFKGGHQLFPNEDRPERLMNGLRFCGGPERTLRPT